MFLFNPRSATTHLKLCLAATIHNLEQDSEKILMFSLILD